MVADKLSYFIRTGQMVQQMQSKGQRITYIQLARYWPLPGMAAPPPPPLGPAATLVPEHPAGDSSSTISKLTAAIVIPIMVLAGTLAAICASFLCIRRRRSHAVRSTFLSK